MSLATGTESIMYFRRQVDTSRIFRLLRVSEVKGGGIIHLRRTGVARYRDRSPTSFETGPSFDLHLAFNTARLMNNLTHPSPYSFVDHPSFDPASTSLLLSYTGLLRASIHGLEIAQCSKLPPPGTDNNHRHLPLHAHHLTHHRHHVGRLRARRPQEEGQPE